jgi:BTB And C-terminal Kelch
VGQWLSFALQSTQLFALQAAYARDNFSEVLALPSRAAIASLPREVLVDLLHDEALQVSSELEVFEVRPQ